VNIDIEIKDDIAELKVERVFNIDITGGRQEEDECKIERSFVMMYWRSIN
jgi:hypothetical protein